MRFSDFSRSRNQYTSVSLGTNEEFLHLYNDVEEARRLSFQKSRVLEHDVEDIGLSCLRLLETNLLDRMWQSFQVRTCKTDLLLKRAEKYAQLSEGIADLMLTFEQLVFPALKGIRSSLDDGSLFMSGIWSIRLDSYNGIPDIFGAFAKSVSSGLESAHKIVVSALALLSFVYQYLIGCVDKGGSKTYSPGSFLFRLIFVAIVLFLGSYVWIKCRQASFTANRRKRKLGDESDVPGGVYRRAVKDSRGLVTHYKYEPRFKPLREKSQSGSPLNFNCLSLGSYNTRREAEVVRNIAVVLYGEEEVRPVQFEDGFCLPFPSLTEPEKCPPSGKEKAVWVTRKTKELYAELMSEKARRLQLPHPAFEPGSHHGHDGEDSRRDPSASAPGAPSTAVELTCFTPPHGGNGAVEEWATSESHGLGQEPPIARGVFSAFFSASDLEQIFCCMPQWEEKNFPAMDDLDKVVGDNSETDCVFVFESTLVPPQSIALDIPTSAIVASLTELGGGDQGFEIIEPHLNSATAITSQQLESLSEQVQLQQRVTSQEQRPQEFSGSNVELQQKLLESEVRNSELQQELHQSKVENEKWRSMFHQVAKLMSASNLDGNPVDLQ